MTGAASFHAGLAAEDQVARHYARSGHTILARRWRGRSGEIDLVFQDEQHGFLFVEVKHARDHTRAAERLSARQLQRIRRSSEEFLATAVTGDAAEARIDLALVDGRGAISVIENISL